MDARHHNPFANPASLRAFLAVAALVIGLTAAIFTPAAEAAPSDITTVAGSGVNGYGGDGGSATSAQMMAPAGVAFGSGNRLYIADFFAHTVRRVNAGGNISTIAGTGLAGYSGDGGSGSAAQLNMPADVVTDGAGNTYIADFGNHRVRQVSPGGTITNFAGTGTAGYSGDSGPALLAQLYNPAGLDIDAAGNIYVTEYGNGTVRKITPGGVITTLAGTGVNGYGGDGGPATAAQMNAPTDIVVDGDGTAYIAELYGHRVRKVTAGGTITTLAGTGVAGNSGNGGPATLAQLNMAAGVDVDSTGNVFIAEYGNHDIRKVTPAGTISRVAGTGVAGGGGDGGPALSAQLNTPSRVTLDPAGNFYISDWGNHRVRHVEALGTPAAPTFAGSTPASPSQSSTPLIRGTSSFGVTVRLYTNASCSSAVAGSGTPADFSSPGLSVTVPADSTTTYWAKALDAGGNESGCSTSSFTYVEDSTAPAAPSIVGSPGSPDNDQTPTWSFSGEAGATFECRLMRGATVVFDWATCPNPQTYDLGAAVDGTYDLSVRAVDAAGNTGPAAASSGYALDRTPPAAPSIGSAPASPDNDTTPEWSFTGEAGAAFECRLERGATVIEDWTSCTSAKGYALSTDGAYTFSVRATDPVGNIGEASSSAYTLDRAAPAAPSIDSSPPSPDNDDSPTWSFSGEANAAFECRLERGTTVIDDWDTCTGAQSYDLDLEPDGDYDFSVRATDVAGNTGAASTSTYELDTAGPAAPSIGSSPATPDDHTMPEWSFSGEANAAFECRLARGVTVVSDWTVCTAPESYNLSAQADGTYDFSVRATDLAGNTGAEASSSYDLDRAAPAPPTFDSVPVTPSANESPDWEFSGEAGAAFECLVMRGSTIVSGWATCSSPESVELSGQPDGSYSLSVRATDAAGNTGSAASSAYQLDRVAPAAPSIDASPATPSNDLAPSWTFSGEAGAAFECRLDRGSTAVAGWATCASPKPWTLSGEPDGDYDFSVRAIDPAGNTGPAATSSYELDTAGPAAPSIGSGPAALSADDEPAWSFTSETGATFECRILRGSTVVGDWGACTDPKIYLLGGEADGDYDFFVRATDVAGNLGAAASASYELDRTAPAAPSIDLEPATPGNSRSPAWQFSGEAGADFECRLARGATVVSDWATCSGTRVYDLLLEPDGTYAFSVRASDAVGNTGAAATSDYVLDTAAPAAPSIDSAPATPDDDETPSWSFSAEAGAALECRVERGATVVADWAACISPDSVNLSAQPDGGYTFRVRATDAAGNTGSAASSAYTLDRSAPSAPAIDSAPATPDDNETPEWSFSSEPGAAFECRLTRGATVVGDWAACADPRSYSLSAETDGSYAFHVRATDVAGNTGPAASSAYTLDRAAPAAPSIDLEPATPGSNRSPAWAFSGEAGAAFECRLARGVTVVEDWASCAGTRVYDLLLEPDGTYDFSVRATDAVGNTGPAASSSYVLDTTAPAAPVIDSAPTSPGNDETPAWSFTGEAGAALECRLERGATVIDDWASCSDPKGYDLNSEPDGDYDFKVRARDDAGNTGATATSSYRLDTNAPAAPSIDAAPASPDDDATPSWSFSGEAGAALECRLVRGATVIDDWASCSDPKDYDLGSEPDGTYGFSVRATDAAGNTGPATTSSYDLDRTAPAAPAFDSVPVTPSPGESPAWQFSGEAGADFECLVMRGATVVSGWADCSSPESVDLSAQPDGTYSLSVRATDAAGNTGSAASSSYELDRTAPAAPSIDSEPASPGRDATPSWSFSGESGAAFECRLERGATVVSGWAACSDPRGYVLSSEPDGDYRFSVRARDAAGNAGPAATSDYELDTAAPGAPSIDSAPASPGNDATPEWGFSGNSGAAFECRLERGATVVSDWASCTSAKGYDLNSEPDGDYDFRVRATDAAGNTGPAGSSAYTFDTAPPADPAIDAEPASPSADTTPAWSFSGPAGAALECRLERGATVVSDWAGCASPLAYDLDTQSDGDYSFLVRARDAAGNLSGSDSSLYILDRSVPAVPTVDAAPDPVDNDVTPSWGFSGDSNARGFECRLERGAAVVEGWAACTDPKSFDLNGEPDGDYDFSVRAINRAGTPSEPATGTYRLDRAAPAGPSIDSAPGSPGRDNGPAWSFSGEAGATFECRLEGSDVPDSNWATCVSPRAFDLDGLGDGSYTFGVRATDVAGNTGPASTSAYQLDRTAPGAPSIQTAPASPTSGTSPEWAFTGEPGAAFECRLTLAGTAIANWAACVSPRGYDVAAQPDGLFGFSVRARDAAGNTGAEANSGFELDRAGAVAAITGSPGAVGRDRRPGWSFDSEAGASFRCRLEREGAVVENWAACSSPHSYDLTSRPDGPYTFLVRGRDATGNTGDPVSSRYVLDGVAPAAPSIEELGSPSRDRRPRWRFDGEPGATLECRLEGSGVLVSDWATCVSPRVFDLAGLGDGRYSLAVRGTDAAGNTGPAAGSGYDLDTTPPDKPRVTSKAGPSGADTTPGFEFAGERGATYDCALTRDGREISARASCASPQSYDLSSEPDGDYAIAVRGTDSAGNVSAPGTAGYVMTRDAGPDAEPGAGGALPPGIAEPRKPDSEGGPGPDSGGAATAPVPAADDPSNGGTQADERNPEAGGAEPGEGTAVGKAINEELAKRLTGITAATTPPNPAKQGSRVVKTLGQVAGAVARNADKTFFPTLLILMVVGFFGIQNRIDRNDPKLGLAPVFADQDLEFGPPPSK